MWKFLIVGAGMLATSLSIANAAENPFAFETADDSSLSSWQPVLELNLREDRVRDLPRPVEADFDRWEARLFTGIEWRPSETLLARATGRAFFAEQDNAQMASNLDNERLDERALDEMFIDVQDGGMGFRVGQSALPLPLSPMVWDQDVRWRGLQLHAARNGVTRTFGVTAAGGFLDHGFGSDTEIAVAQGHWRAGYIPGSTEVLLALIAFDELGSLPEAVRTNSRDPLVTAPRVEFRVADLQFVQTFNAGSGSWRMGIDIARNLEAETSSDAARFDIRYGNARNSGDFEIGAALQRIQADAVPAAFNDDDWWFPTRMRGHSLWIARGFAGGWRLRAAGFREKRDGMSEYMQRVLVDLSYHY